MRTTMASVIAVLCILVFLGSCGRTDCPIGVSFDQVGNDGSKLEDIYQKAATCLKDNGFANVITEPHPTVVLAERATCSDGDPCCLSGVPSVPCSDDPADRCSVRALMNPRCAEVILPDDERCITGDRLFQEEALEYLRFINGDPDYGSDTDVIHIACVDGQVF